MSFSDFAVPAGLGKYPMETPGFGGGIAAADFDDDGDIDLFLPTAAGEAHRLYRNQGDGTFQDVADSLGITTREHGRSALWFDYDGDGRLDLLIGNDCFSRSELCSQMTTFLRLYRQTKQGTFVETTAAAGLMETGQTAGEHRTGMAAADLNGDGFLDFVAGFWGEPGLEGSMNLYLNQRDGTFLESSAAAGIDDATLAYHQPLLIDFNGDGRIDLFASVDFAENRLWIHQGNAGRIPTFLELARESGCDNSMNDMGVAAGDFDHDGDPDLYVTNVFRNQQHNILERNDTEGEALRCTEISREAGVDEGGWGWGATFLDIDNDGFLDLAETNGWVSSGWESPPRLFVRTASDSLTFSDLAAAAGLTDDAWGTTLIAIDYDRDGDQDLLQTSQKEVAPREGGKGELGGRLSLHRNELAPSYLHFLTIRPRMAGPNRRAIGARVMVRAGDHTMTRWITAGTSYLGQEPAEASFGLGTAAVAEEVTIDWPDGERSVLSDVPADQILTVFGPRIFEDGFESGDDSKWSGSAGPFGLADER